MHGIFAFIRPLNPCAQEAYHDAIEYSRKTNVSGHYSQYQQLFSKKKVERTLSVFSGEEDNPSSEEKEQWNGGFALSLETPPRDNQLGWVLGTQRGISEEKRVDVLLGPLEGKWSRRGMAGRHCQISFHPRTYRLIIRARHSMLMSTEGMRSLARNDEHSLEHRDIFHIGDSSYVLELTAYHRSSEFVDTLSDYMKNVHGPNWSLTGFLTPASIGLPISICGGKFLTSPNTIGEGTYGLVRAGWERESGNGVAIKKFKDPDKKTINHHKSIMRLLGEHVSCNPS